MWVVKLGGSLAKSENLRRWLNVIATAGAGKVVLVPGGGPFADAVRNAQQQTEFDDHTAHRMALLAMEQYGLMLCGLQAGLVAAGSTATIRSALEKEEVPVWMPSALVLGEPAIPESWDATSDSLAAWLTARLRASALVLVKSVKVDDSRMSAAELQQCGLVDNSFPRFTANACFSLVILGNGDHDRLGRMLAGESANP